jgi:hypothetical protein
MDPNPFDPKEWAFLSPQVDPTFVLTEETPASVTYLRGADPGWLPLFDAFVQKNHPGLVLHLGVVDQYERRYRQSLLSGAADFDDVKFRLKSYFTAKNAHLAYLNEEQKAMVKAESDAYVASVEALTPVWGQFEKKVQRLRELIVVRGGSFNVMIGRENTQEVIGQYWQVYATLASALPQLESLRAGFRLLCGLNAFEGTSVEGQFTRFREQVAAAEATVRSTSLLALDLWDAITKLEKEIAAGGFPQLSTTTALGGLVRKVQVMLAAIGHAYYGAARACADWANANAEDLASKKIYLDNPVGGKIYRAITSFLDIGLGVVRFIELDTKVITLPLTVLKTAITTAVELKDSAQAWDDRPDHTGEQITRTAKFSLVGTTLDKPQDATKYSGYATSAAGMLSSLDVPLGGAAEEIPFVGAGLKIAKGALDLTKLDAQQIATVEGKEEAQRAKEMVYACLGSWNHLGILDFGAGVFLERRTPHGFRVRVTNRHERREISGWINDRGQFFSDEGDDHTIDLALVAAKRDTRPRHQAAGAQPMWDSLTFVRREKPAGSDVFVFWGNISFAGREDYDGPGEVRVHLGADEFEYLRWEAADLPTQALLDVLAPYLRVPGMLELKNGKFELHMASDEWDLLWMNDQAEAINLSVCVEKWRRWHDAGLIKLQLPAPVGIGIG